MYYGARYYDPELARFIQADTVIPYIDSSQSFNRYMYCRGNPIIYVDPTGNQDSTTTATEGGDSATAGGNIGDSSGPGDDATTDVSQDLTDIDGMKIARNDRRSRGDEPSGNGEYCQPPDKDDGKTPETTKKGEDSSLHGGRSGDLSAWQLNAGDSFDIRYDEYRFKLTVDFVQGKVEKDLWFLIVDKRSLIIFKVEMFDVRTNKKIERPVSLLKLPGKTYKKTEEKYNLQAELAKLYFQDKTGVSGPKTTLERILRKILKAGKEWDFQDEEARGFINTSIDAEVKEHKEEVEELYNKLKKMRYVRFGWE
jgi:hypothetical protein